MKPISTTLIDPCSTDGLQLSGLLFPAESSIQPKTAIIYLHGNGSKGIFYAHEWNQAVSSIFNQQGIAYCTVNNRWAMLTTSLDVCDENGIVWDANAGVWYEKIEDCVYDIDGVVEYLKNLGYERFFLMGKSTGANKICVYHEILQKQWKKTPFAGYILLSGWDDIGLWYEDMGAELFQEVLSNAKKALQEKKGEEQRPVTCRCFLEDFSYQSAADILDPDGLYNCFPFFEVFRERLGTKELFREFSTLDIPTLVMYWAEDEYVRFPMDEVIALLKSHNSSADYESIPSANHSFDGHEKILAERILAWINSIKN